MTMPEVGSAPPAATASTTPRVLPPEEWERLRGLPFATNGLPDPASSVIIVVETPDGEIVGLWALMLQPFLDGLWTHPDHQHKLAAGQLLRTMKAVLQEYGVSTAFTIISDPAVMALAHKAGFTRAPGDLWLLPIPPKEGT
jgi:hypothetical protein